MRCIIRKATLDDAAALCALHKASVRSLCAGVYSADQIEAWLASRAADLYRNAMTVEEQTKFVAQRDGRTVGFASIKGDTLKGLYVDPTHGRGAGRILLRTAEDHARSEGIAVLSLQATLNAVPFYERHGFVAGQRGAVVRGGLELPVVEMSKSLRSSNR